MNLFDRRKRRFEIEANRFGLYNVVKLLHDGDKARVYQAQHRTRADIVAIKAYKPEFNRAALELRKKYGIPGEGELGVLLTMDDKEGHAPIARVFDYGTEFGKANGNEYIVMEYVDGVNLKHLVSCRHEILTRHAKPIIRQMVAGLAFLHAHGMVHRDFCTDNVIVINADKVRVKIIDLGFTTPMDIAFEERSGTPSYMAPEQIRAEPLTARTDIYSLGVVLYEMLTSRLPFTSDVGGDTPRQLAKRHKELMDKHLYVQPQPPAELNPNINDILNKTILCCLAKPADARFESLQELAQALKRAGWWE